MENGARFLQYYLTIAVREDQERGEESTIFEQVDRVIKGGEDYVNEPMIGYPSAEQNHPRVID
jgi:hypothetical protein